MNRVTHEDLMCQPPHGVGATLVQCQRLDHAAIAALMEDPMLKQPVTPPDSPVAEDAAPLLREDEGSSSLLLGEAAGAASAPSARRQKVPGTASFAQRTQRRKMMNALQSSEAARLKQSSSVKGSPAIRAKTKSAAAVKCTNVSTDEQYASLCPGRKTDLWEEYQKTHDLSSDNWWECDKTGCKAACKKWSVLKGKTEDRHCYRHKAQHKKKSA
jgi:hypothetical protein